MNSKDISNAGLGDVIYSPDLGEGKVIACTEKPSIRVEFSIAGKRWLTKDTFKHYNCEIK
jgi:hypothetical protein